MSETIVYFREDGKLVIWDSDSPDGWMLVDPDIIMEDEDALTGPQTTREDWK